MEANPEPADAVSDQFFEALVKAASTPVHPVRFAFHGDASQYQTFDGVEEEITQVAALFDGDVICTNIKTDIARRTVTVDVVLHEPSFSNHVYGKLKLINDKLILEWLVKSKYTDPINPEGVYACSLVLEPNTTNINLQWNGGSELMYRFDGMGSNRYIFFKFLFQNTDIVHTIDDLKAKQAVSTSTTKLHEFYTKSFLKGAIKDKFAIVSEKEHIGIKSVVQLTGKQLIQIIRSNLSGLENSQSRHLVRKLVKYESTLSNSADK